MIQIIKNILTQFINDIDSGNSNMNELEQEELVNLLLKFNLKELTKLEAADYINASRATFDNYIVKGLIPKGRKKRGSKALYWYKSDLDKYLNEKC